MKSFTLCMLAIALLFAVAGAPRRCIAVPVSPRVLDATRGTVQESSVLRAGSRYKNAKRTGVDRIYKQFALRLSSSAGALGHRNVLVVLCDFDAEAIAPAWHPDPGSTPAYYDSLFFSDDPADGLTSLREYYRDNSHGRLLVSGRVTTWLKMPHSYAYYTNAASGLDFAAYPRSAQRLAEDAMAAAFQSLGDLTWFDNDGPDGIPHSGDDDGYVDAVCVLHAGTGAEVVYSDPSAQLWSHEAAVSVSSGCPAGESSPDCRPGMALGDVRGFLYFLVPEFYDWPRDRMVGTYFHEFAHTIGLPDLYSISSAGLGFYSLMGLGSYLPYGPGQVLASHPCGLDAWSRQFIGLEVPEVPRLSGHQQLEPASAGGGSIKAWTFGEPGIEYFLLESRWKSGADQYLPGEGLLVYHVDDSRIDNLFDPPRVRIVQADGRRDLDSEYGNFGDAGDPFPGSSANHLWTESTIPTSRADSGADTQVRMSGITSLGAGGISFDLSVSTHPALRVATYRVRDGGNGFPDAGETDSLFLSVRNAGASTGSVSYVLATDDPYFVLQAGTSTSSPVETDGTTELASPFVFDVASPPVLPHVVTFTLSWTDGTDSGAIPFTLALGMRDQLSESFEGTAPGWTHEAIPPSHVDEWHATSSRAYDGAMSMKLGSFNALGEGSYPAQSYAPLQDAALVSPLFQVVRGTRLTFRSWTDMETNGGGSAWDGGRIEIAVNGGPWRPLDVNGGYGYVVAYNSTSTLRGEDAFSGSTLGWRRVVADLSAYQGAARLRFRFSSDETNGPFDLAWNPLRAYEGWYVDDVRIASELAMSVDLDPNVLNVKSQLPWITAYIESSEFDPSEIELTSLVLAGSVHPELKSAQVGDHNADGRPDLMVKIRRVALGPMLTLGWNDLSMTGSLVTGEHIAGSARLRVIDPGQALAASLAPNPLRTVGTLRFETSTAGRVRIELFDARGRSVRVLEGGRAMNAGRHEIALDGKNDAGRDLPRGIYFYRVDAADGRATGRVAVVR
jgi:M6 family metalloprotease-like protein